MWFVGAFAAEGQSQLTKPFTWRRIKVRARAMRGKLRIRQAFLRKAVSSHQLRHVLSQIEFIRHSFARGLAHRLAQGWLAQQLDDSSGGTFDVATIDQIA